MMICESILSMVDPSILSMVGSEIHFPCRFWGKYDLNFAAELSDFNFPKNDSKK
jgi:hypothetical protein